MALVCSAPAGVDASKRTPPPASEDRPLVRLIPNLVKDIRALPSQESLMLLMAGTAGSAVAGTRDGSAEEWALSTGRSSASRAGSAVGEGWVQGALAFGTYVTGAAFDNRQLTHLGSDLVRSQILNGLFTTGLKVAVDRTRPNGGQYSFPSGHTSASFTTAAVVYGHYGWKAGVPALGLATFIGWARVRDRAHWPSDIVSGATIGSIIGFTVTRDHRNWTWSVAPTTTSTGGVGVVVTKNLSK